MKIYLKNIFSNRHQLNNWNKIGEFQFHNIEELYNDIIIVDFASKNIYYTLLIEVDVEVYVDIGGDIDYLYNKYLRTKALNELLS